MRIPFGKYIGAEISDVPHDYLCWVLNNLASLRPDLRLAIEDHLGSLRPPKPAPAPAPRPAPAVPVAALQSVYREMSRRFHPDHGGSHDAMIAVNCVFERIRETL